MKLFCKDQIIKESDDVEELERERRAFVRAELHKKVEFQRRYMDLNESLKHVLPRNPADSEEAYLEKVRLVNTEFSKDMNNNILI